MHVGSTGRGTKLGCAWLRRDALVASAAQRWIIHPSSAGMTGMPLQFCLSEESACRVRRPTFDHPFRFGGHRGFSPSPTLPARGEGESISPRMRGDVRGAALLRLWRNLLVRFTSGGTRLSRPPHNVGSSISLHRARRARPSDSLFGGTRLSRPVHNVGSSIPLLRA